MPRGFAHPRTYRGESDLRPTLTRNQRAIETHLNAYVPSYDEEDGSTLRIVGDLYTSGDIYIPTGATVDGIDPSAHNHDGTDDNGMVLDHGTLIGRTDDDHTQYLTDGRHSAVHLGTKVGRATTYGLTTSWQTIPWTNELQDDGDWHNNATNPSRITVDADGWYLLAVGYNVSGLGGDVQVRVNINGTDNVGRFDSDMSYFRTSWPVYMEDGDYAEVDMQLSSGTATLQNNNQHTWFSLVRL